MITTFLTAVNKPWWQSVTLCYRLLDTPSDGKLCAYTRCFTREVQLHRAILTILSKMYDCRNHTCPPPSIYNSYTMQQLYVAILLILAVLGTFGNMLVIAAVILSRKLRHATNMFVLNLSIADLLTCAYVVPVQAVAVLSEFQIRSQMSVCQSAAFLLVLCLGCSINSLTCIAINRYFLVVN